MSRVTIKELYGEDDYIIDYDEAIKNIEIVPRKIVEMIIAECTKDICAEHKSDGAKAEASLIKRYAEELLEKFEADGEV